MSRSAPIVATIVFSVILVSGCAARTPGSPTPAATETTGSIVPTETSTPDSTAPSRSARPHELRLDGKDACSLIPPSELSKFFIEKPGKPNTDPVLNSPDCFYVATSGELGVELVVTEGIDAWRGGKRMGKDTEIPPINGYAAISIVRPGDTEECDIAVDVAAGQYVLGRVIVDPNMVSKVPPMCAYARQWTELAMNTLVAQR